MDSFGFSFSPFDKSFDKRGPLDVIKPCNLPVIGNVVLCHGAGFQTGKKGVLILALYRHFDSPFELCLCFLRCCFSRNRGG